MGTKEWSYKGEILVAPGAKAFEQLVFGPCTLVRTWGTRPARLQRDCGLFLDLQIP
jgi:hypothetical protein